MQVSVIKKNTTGKKTIEERFNIWQKYSKKHLFNTDIRKRDIPSWEAKEQKPLYLPIPQLQAFTPGITVQKTPLMRRVVSEQRL